MKKDLGKFIATTVSVGAVFSMVLMIGFFARVSGLEVSEQDKTVVSYLLASFSGTLSGELLLTFIFITLLAAGMSTLDGILVSLSAMVVNDIIKPLSGSVAQGLVWSRWVLIIVGAIGLIIAWNPPALIGLFAQKGVYGLASASVVPVLFGVLYRKSLPLSMVFIASLIGLSAHFYFNLWGGVANPAVSSSYGILLSIGFMVSGLLLRLFLFGRRLGEI